MERAVEEGREVEEGCVRIPLAQPGHAHGQAGEQQEERVGEGEGAQPVAEHLAHLGVAAAGNSRRRERGILTP